MEFCGHTHLQSLFQHENKTLLNPGSAGLSLKAEEKSRLMILHGEDGSWKEEFVSPEYDRLTVIKQLEESGLAERSPYWCKVAERLLRGLKPEITHTDILIETMNICRRETGKCIWPDIPEKDWEQAIKVIFLDFS